MAHGGNGKRAPKTQKKHQLLVVECGVRFGFHFFLCSICVLRSFFDFLKQDGDKTPRFGDEAFRPLKSTTVCSV